MVSERRHLALKIKEHRDALIRSVRTQLLPVLIKEGFAAAPRAQNGPTDRESELSFPLGQLIRARRACLDVVEIQFAPHRRASFRINAGVVPKEA